MRHRKRGRKLSRTAAHREALRRNMAKALLEHERIVTTPTKAKEARPFVERLITLARRALPYRGSDNPEQRARYLHFYRQALNKLQDRALVQKLFGEGEWREQECLAERYADRPGGYTRIVRLSGSRLGVPVGSTMGEMSKLTYTMAGKSRTIRLTGNRLGDNAPRAIFELVEKEKPAGEEEVAPRISVSDEAPETEEAEAGERPEQAQNSAEQQEDEQA